MFESMALHYLLPEVRSGFRRVQLTKLQNYLATSGTLGTPDVSLCRWAESWIEWLAEGVRHRRSPDKSHAAFQVHVEVLLLISDNGKHECDSDSNG